MDFGAPWRSRGLSCARVQKTNSDILYICLSLQIKKHMTYPDIRPILLGRIVNEKLELLLALGKKIGVTPIVVYLLGVSKRVRQR